MARNKTIKKVKKIKKIKMLRNKRSLKINLAIPTKSILKRN
jgi:hypothetical protein